VVACPAFFSFSFLISPKSGIKPSCFLKLGHIQGQNTGKTRGCTVFASLLVKIFQKMNKKGKRKMKLELQHFVEVLKRVLIANLNGEHYWFIPKPSMVYVEDKSEKDTRKN
jgi:hypothetical protein